MKNRSLGFTLVELMVVLSIAAAVLVIGVPAFKNFRENGRLTNTANDMLSATIVARTEAIKQQKQVSLCPSSNPTGDQPTCTADSTAGWIVFVDTDGNCTRTGDDTEPLLGGRALDNSNVANPLKVKYDGECLSFVSTGFRKEVKDKTTLNHILICDSRGTAPQAGTNVSAARAIIITATGRARITRALSSGMADDVTKWDPAGACP